MASPEELDKLAREMYQKPYDQLETNEKRSVAGKVGGEHRKQQMAEQAGGDVHAAYSEMGSQGGKTTGEGGGKE